MKIATWNVNSIRVRLDNVLNFLVENEIDFLGMQEIKAPDEKFPYNNFRRAGYEVEVFGEVGFNGVSIASKLKMENVKKGFSLDPKSQKRMISCCVGDVNIINVYVPNGKQVGISDYYYKLEYLSRLRDYLELQLKDYDKILLIGDLNVALSDLDVYNSEQMSNAIVFTTPERKALESIIDTGFVDLLRKFHPQESVFSFWDYRANAFLRNKGMRVDYILASNTMDKYALNCESLIKERSKRNPSDHAPLVAIFGDVS